MYELSGWVCVFQAITFLTAHLQVHPTCPQHIY